MKPKQREISPVEWMIIIVMIIIFSTSLCMRFRTVAPSKIEVHAKYVQIYDNRYLYSSIQRVVKEGTRYQVAVDFMRTYYLPEREGCKVYDYWRAQFE